MAAEEKSLTRAVEARLSLAETMAHAYGMEAAPFLDAIKRAVFPPADRKGAPPTDAHLIAYMSACNEVGLNPFLGHVWPFPLQSGGFKPVASLDGWLHILNSHPQYDGDEYTEITDEDGKLVAGEVKIYRKDRSRPTIHREYLIEVRRDTEPWKVMPHRMLKNRTYCQGIRRTMGIGLPDEEDVRRGEEINVTAESIEMERTTETRADALRSKIQRARTETAPPAAPEAPPHAAPPPPAEPAGGAVALDEQDAGEPSPAPVDALITDEQRQTLIDVVDNRYERLKDGKMSLAVKSAIAKKLKEIGISKTAEIRQSQYQDMMSWASEFRL